MFWIWIFGFGVLCFNANAQPSAIVFHFLPISVENKKNIYVLMKLRVI